MTKTLIFNISGYFIFCFICFSFRIRCLTIAKCRTLIVSAYCILYPGYRGKIWLNITKFEILIQIYLTIFPSFLPHSDSLRPWSFVTLAVTNTLTITDWINFFWCVLTIFKINSYNIKFFKKNYPCLTYFKLLC